MDEDGSRNGAGRNREAQTLRSKQSQWPLAATWPFACPELLAPNGENIVLQQIVQLPPENRKKSKEIGGETPFKMENPGKGSHSPRHAHQLPLLLTIWKIYQKIQGAGNNMTPSDRSSRHKIISTVKDPSPGPWEWKLWGQA